MRARRSWHLRLVGEIQVRAVEGTDDTWTVPCVGSRKARTLIALLGTRAGQAVPVELVIEAVWSGALPRRPEANVATLVSRLRATLGRGVIVGGRGWYRLGDAVSVDLDDAADLVAGVESCLVRGQPGQGLPAAEWAIRLLDRGQVLADQPGADWAEPARARQAALLRRARHAAAECALGTGDPGRAQLRAESAIGADSLDEAAYRMMMRACVALGEPARALVVYQRLRTTLAAELGSDPAAATQDLYLTLVRLPGIQCGRCVPANGADIGWIVAECRHVP
jgi:DNA-binding SARP family transcriptional activator